MPSGGGLYPQDAGGDSPLRGADEYDTPIQSGDLNDVFNDVTRLFRNFLSAALEDKLFLFVTVMSYQDPAGREPEKPYHGFILGPAGAAPVHALGQPPSTKARLGEPGR
ncbi:hypothetical protein [Sorangium sp. So ce887]|uniref:hypothetical protein n=1 Tax=Sorangium sp. So ce887 TaxID=3133324 RepID=UPI003F6318C2